MGDAPFGQPRSCNVIGTYFIELAKKEVQHRFGHVPDKDLSYFAEGSQSFNDYVEAVEWAQEYAFENRKEMMRLILEAIRPLLPSFQMTKEAINCHHNYVSQETHFGENLFVTRKGAIRAGLDELGIIPALWEHARTLLKVKQTLNLFVLVLMELAAK